MSKNRFPGSKKGKVAYRKIGAAIAKTKPRIPFPGISLLPIPISSQKISQRYLLNFFLICVFGVTFFRPCVSLLLAQENPQINNQTSCPGDVKILTEQMLTDLPSYANRVIQRARRLNRDVDIFSYVIIAGKAEFEPLTLGPGEYNPTTAATTLEPPQQIFFTTLERQYTNKKAFESQHYHWLFLVQTDSGWRIATIFSRIGSPSEQRPPLPPRETSQGTIGQAVKLWLRDCRAGTLRS